MWSFSTGDSAWEAIWGRFFSKIVRNFGTRGLSDLCTKNMTIGQKWTPGHRFEHLLRQNRSQKVQERHVSAQDAPKTNEKCWIFERPVGSTLEPKSIKNLIKLRLDFCNDFKCLLFRSWIDFGSKAPLQMKGLGITFSTSLRTCEKCDFEQPSYLYSRSHTRTARKMELPIEAALLKWHRKWNREFEIK